MDCENCRYYLKKPDKSPEGEQVGWCRRRAPQPLVASLSERRSGSLVADWPVVWQHDWCGEHEEATNGR